MRLLSLEVQNYRNICAARLEPGRELTVICGNNGQGKTNLLEAIWLLTGGKSFRGGKDAELVRRGEAFAVLEADTQRDRPEGCEPAEPAHIRMTVGTPEAAKPGRYAAVNGAAPKRAAALAGSFPAVVFDPGHLSLVKGAPEGRRKFLDAALCQLYPGYLASYRRYVRVLQQKNALLRHSANGQERPYAEKRTLLEVLNTELAAQGEALQQRRREYLKLLAPRACANYAERFPRGRTDEHPLPPVPTFGGRAGSLPTCCVEAAGGGAARRAEPVRHPPRGLGAAAGRPARPGVCQSGTAAQRGAEPENGRSCGGGADHRGAPGAAAG